MKSSEWPREDHPLKHAPHPAEVLTSEGWNHPYTREQAVYPRAELKQPGRKYWPPVARIDQAHGDRHLVCTCPPMEQYAEAG